MTVLFVLRSLFGAMFFIVATLLLSLAMIVVSLIFPERNLQSKIMEIWGRLGLAFFGVDLEVLGKENIPQGAGLFLFNHSSFFDIFAMMAAFSDFRFGAKIELFKIPFFGRAMRMAGILPIARNKREEVFKIYEEAHHRAQQGEKFALAPEGGRNYDGKLLPFKAGPFIFAINSKLCLIPTVIQGAHEIMSKKALLPNTKARKRIIRVSYLPPISVQGFALENRAQLQELAYKRMNEYLSQNPISK